MLASHESVNRRVPIKDVLSMKVKHLVSKRRATPDRRTDFALDALTISRAHVSNNVAVYVGETQVRAGVAISQVSVVRAHHAENGGVEVVDVNRVFGRAVAVHVPSGTE